MNVSLNKGIRNYPIQKSSEYQKKNNISFSANPLSVLRPQNLVNKIPDKFWQKMSDAVPEKIIKNKHFQGMLDMAKKNGALFEALVVLGLSTTLRPASILAVPGAPMEDRKYAAAKSIATGVVGFGLTAAIYIPVAAATEHLGKLAKAIPLKKGFPAKGTGRYNVVEYLATMGSKILLAPLDAKLLYLLVPPIVHKLLDKKKTPASDPQTMQQKGSVNPNSKGKV